MRAACLFVCLLAASATGAERPCVVFCVGIEKYDARSLNPPLLRTPPKSVAEDAVAVWDRLHEIAAVDRKRSRLLVVDSDGPKERPALPLPEAHPAMAVGLSLAYWAAVERKALRFAELEAELREFLARTTKDDLVVIYLGGHGEKRDDAPATGVHFLASDYRRTADGTGIQNALTVPTLIRMLSEEYSGPKQGAEIVVFANMCYAGAGVDHELGTVPGGARPPKLAYIPACGDVRTYERNGGRSVFAHRLLAALGGKGSDGARVTAKSVLSYLQTDKDIRAPQPIPVPADDIVIGTVLPEQVAARRLLAHTLLANGLDADGHDREMMIRLAESHYKMCANTPAEGKAADQLGAIRCRAETGRDPSDEVAWLRAAARDKFFRTPDADADPLVAKLLAAPALARPGLEARPFVAVVVGWDSGTGKETRANPDDLSLLQKLLLRLASETTPTGTNIDDVRRWEKFLTEAPGHVHTEARTLALTDGSITEEELIEAIDRQVRVARGKALGRSVDLILVVTGLNVGDGRPLSRYLVTRPDWADRFVAVWDGAEGGKLAPAEDRAVSLLLTASQPNGVASSSPPWNTTPRMIRALRDGGDEKAFRAMHAGLVTDVASAQSEVEGRPAALPAWVGPPHPALAGPRPAHGAGLRDVLGTYGLPGRWWAGELALSAATAPAGAPRQKCAMDDAEYADATLENRAKCLRDADIKNPFARLELAALCESVGWTELAAENYARFAAAGHATDPVPGVIRTARKAAQARLLDFQTGAEKRGKVQGEVARKALAPVVHFVPAAAVDYHTPLIGDLSGTPGDAAAWERALRDRFGDRLKVYPRAGKVDTADDVRGRLAEACRACRPHDQVVFVFTGRGFQNSKDRYLVTEDARRLDTFYFRRAELPVEPRTVVSMAEVAAEFGNAKGACLAVLDCQFTRPDPDATSVLDKHLDSTGHDPNRARQADARRRQEWDGQREFPNASNHTYIWVVGRLADREPRAANRPEAASAASLALLEKLAEARDYGHWVRAAQQWAQTERQFAPNTRFAIQGPVHQPVLTTSGEFPPLRLLAGEHYRTRHNLDLAVDLAALPVMHHDDDPITHAALLVRRAQVRRAAGEGTERDYKAAGEEARALLARVPCVAEFRTTKDLLDVVALTRCGAVELCDGPAAAAADLREWLTRADVGGNVSAPVARRLVELTKAGARLDSARSIRASREALSKTGDEGTERDLLRLEAEVQGSLDQLPVVPVGR